MQKISSLDQRILKHDIKNIFNAIVDFNTYFEWWDKSIKINILKRTENFINSKLEITAYGKKFFCEIVKASPIQEIVINYSGIYSGTGTWFFVEGANGVKVMYEVDLEIKDFLVRLFSFIINLNAIHSKQMAKLFNGLENYLNDKSDSDSLDSARNVQPPTFTLKSN
jgi:ribosome-associated toxin RatA of RatAB toxin-antitoxin module